MKVTSYHDPAPGAAAPLSCAARGGKIMELPADEIPAEEPAPEEDFGAAEAAIGGEEELGRAKRV